jgi:DinB superfamily
VRQFIVLFCLVLVHAAAQPAPVADAFRAHTRRVAKRLILSAEAMPAGKYGFRPTPAQMTFGEVVAHVADDNDIICGTIGGMHAPQRPAMAATDSKAHLVARLEETFAFCDAALAGLDDSRLGVPLPFAGQTETRALIMFQSAGHWSDHYSQAAIYLRLNGLLPPTAKDPTV